MKATASRLSLLVALVGVIACTKATISEPTPVATRTPRPGTPGAEPPRTQEERLQTECPPETRAGCISSMQTLLKSRTDTGRIALCVDRSGNWLERHEKGASRDQELPSDARVGDRCPDAFPYAIRGFYVQEPAR
jgi:hypothetical protein